MRIKLWLLRMHAWSLEQQLITAQQRVLEQRAHVQLLHREIRETRQEIGLLTPASVLLREMIRRRDKRGNSAATPLASRQRFDYR